MADDVSPDEPFARKRIRVDRRADGKLHMA